MEPLLIVGILVGVMLGYLLARVWFLLNIKRLQKKSVHQSRSTTLGFVQEKVAPLLPEFPYHIKDLVFLGKWVDYVVLDGLHAGDLHEVVFVEIKTWTSRLNANERAIKKAIDAWRVRYEVLHY